MSRSSILITLGDPAGIGPEVVTKALASGELPDDFHYEVIGDATCGTPGMPDAASARESLRALQVAAERLRDDPAVAAVVTGPVAKSQLELVGFPYPGQTEFFAAMAGCDDVAMCLTGEHLTVALATIHISLAEVVSQLSSGKIIRVGSLLASDLQRRKPPRTPRIAVAGLNPHAGEAGKFGDEEARIIRPAIDTLNQRFPDVFSGPHVPDAIFRDAARGHYDAVVAMYHDQGLIPLKLLDFDTAVNVTLGLPKPRTSPDHGTAFDIAGQNLANPGSMIRAICVAAEHARDSSQPITP